MPPLLQVCAHQRNLEDKDRLRGKLKRFMVFEVSIRPAAHASPHGRLKAHLSLSMAWGGKR
jgi:hypothetical protein